MSVRVSETTAPRSFGGFAPETFTWFAGLEATSPDKTTTYGLMPIARLPAVMLAGPDGSQHATLVRAAPFSCRAAPVILAGTLRAGPATQKGTPMTIQVLELRLSDMTAGDYIAWCIDPDPPALGLGLRAVTLDADPLGDTVTATLQWDGPSPPPGRAAGAAGLPVHGPVREIARDVRRLTPRSSRASTGGAAAAA